MFHIRTLCYLKVSYISQYTKPMTIYIPAKPLHNRDIVSVHFNHFYYMGICDKLSKDLSVLIYIYFNVDDC